MPFPAGRPASRCQRAPAAWDEAGVLAHPPSVCPSARSTELMRRVRRFQIAQYKCLVIKYAKDVRYSNSFCTHDRSVPVLGWGDIRARRGASEPSLRVTVRVHHWETPRTQNAQARAPQGLPRPHPTVLLRKTALRLHCSLRLSRAGDRHTHPCGGAGQPPWRAGPHPALPSVASLCLSPVDMLACGLELQVKFSPLEAALGLACLSPALASATRLCPVSGPQRQPSGAAVGSAVWGAR